MEYNILLFELESLLGKSYKKARNNYAFHCPFCNHKKPKLEIQMITNEVGHNPWECWVCNTRGRTIKSLLYQLKIPKGKAVGILKLVKNSDKLFESDTESVTLPEEFQPLINASTTSNMANRAKKYLFDRGITLVDIKRYNIGYCTTGIYSDRIIIPSYDSFNNLNYFVSRTFTNNSYKYKNPPFSRDIIFFENLINWNEPIILVEGVFDAMTVRRNAIPILGKTLSKSLRKKLLGSTSTDIYVSLDKDALKEALSIYMNLIEMGKNVYLLNPEEKDPSQLGFIEFTRQISKLQPLTFANLLQLKMSL